MIPEFIDLIHKYIGVCVSLQTLKQTPLKSVSKSGIGVKFLFLTDSKKKITEKLMISCKIYSGHDE